MELTYSSFVLIILIVIFAIYALVAIMYRAVILPIRLIFTIGLTISFIFGATRLVFETNTYLNNIFPVLDDIEVTFWMVPILTFSIILGLGMDYDIFTIERIRENVKKGMSNS
ncbi:MAG: MMPL family transporter, partial [Candidatus Dadabacteria bacterium]|nr:MMPL family transporter [Candidatus Dadabacteria bacterium]